MRDGGLLRVRERDAHEEACVHIRIPIDCATNICQWGDVDGGAAGRLPLGLAVKKKERGSTGCLAHTTPGTEQLSHSEDGAP